MARSVPPGLSIVQDVFDVRLSTGTARMLVLVITFLTYASYHLARKAPSVVKSVLIGDDDTPATGWAPFNGKDGKSMLGNLDMAFLLSYAFAMFISGNIADKMNLRHFLTVGLVMSGLFTAMFGLGFFMDEHSIYYFVGFQIMAGLFQSTGWPAVVAIVGNWIPKGKRGMIMGIWNAHTSVGNILGAIIPAAVIHGTRWGWAYILPGLIMVVIGLIVFLFLPVDPTDLGLPSIRSKRASSDDTTAMPALGSSEKSTETETHKPVGFFAAWAIPGVATYACALFFAKLVAYTFLYWLPFYVHNTPIGGKDISSAQAANLSTLFDVAGCFGGIVCGYLSDRTKASASIATVFLLSAIPMLSLYQQYGHISLGINIALMMASGFMVNGPYALITTAVSAELGTHESLKGNPNALATVTAIIDGTGSLGAALGPPLTGYISNMYGWHDVFYMLYIAVLCAALLLSRVVISEFKATRRRSRALSDGEQNSLMDNAE